MAKAKKPVMLTPEHAALIDEKLRVLADLLPVCDDAEACGVPMDQHREMIDHIRDGLTEIKQRFCPGPRTSQRPQRG